MSIVICLLASSSLHPAAAAAASNSLVSIFKSLVSIFKWSELHTVVKSLIQFKPFLFTSNSSLIWNVEVPKEGQVALVLLPFCSKWELNPAVTWFGQTIPSWMFTHASNSSPQVLLSQEYVLHLLPWARSHTGQVSQWQSGWDCEHLPIDRHQAKSERTSPPFGKHLWQAVILRPPSLGLGVGQRAVHIEEEKQPQLSVLLLIPSKKSLPLLSAEGWSFGINQAPLCGRCFPSSILLHSMP